MFKLCWSLRWFRAARADVFAADVLNLFETRRAARFGGPLFFSLLNSRTTGHEINQQCCFANIALVLGFINSAAGLRPPCKLKRAPTWLLLRYGERILEQSSTGYVWLVQYTRSRPS